jgi:TP901 family phage tail tape measure protein
MSFSAEYIYRILDRYSGPLDKISRSTDKFRSKAAAASERVGHLSKRMESAGQTMANFRSAIGGAAITAGMFKFAQSASTIEDAMADVERVTGLTGTALSNMQSNLQKMGRETGKSAIGLAAIAFEGGKLGITNDTLMDFVLTVAKTSAAFDMADSEAGRAIGSIRAKLGMSVKDVDTLMQRVNFLADNTSASGAQMIEIIERTSGTFKTLHIPTAVTAGWAAFANQVEVSPELAASGLNMMMARLMQMPGMLDKMLKDPQNAVMDFLKRFEKMPEAARGAAILKTFGQEAGRFVLKAVGNTKLLDQAMETAASNKALGSMDREFANILKRSSTAAKRIKETLIDVSRTIGAVFLRVFDKYAARIQQATEFVFRFIKTHPGIVKIAGAFAAFLAVVTAVVIPIGILFSIIAGGLPVLTGLLAAVSAISAPVIIAAAGITAFVAWIGLAYARSAMFRQSLVNLADAFSPLVDGLKMLVSWIGEKLGVSFQGSQGQMQAWGNVMSIVINMTAAYFKTLFDIIKAMAGFISGVFTGNFTSAFESITGLFDPLFGMFDKLFEKVNILSNVKAGFGKLFEGDFKGAWSELKGETKPVGFGTPDTEPGMMVSHNKAASRSQDNKMQVSGQIGVTASGGAKVERANINLNTGYNLAVSH